VPGGLQNELHARPSIYFNEPAHVYHLTLLEQGNALDRLFEALDNRFLAEASQATQRRRDHR